MKRLALSVLAGFVFPFGYGMIAAMLSPYVKSETLNLLAGYPVLWPLMILYRFGFPVEKNVTTLLYVAGCNVMLYTLLTYWFLWATSKSKPRKSVPPPNPPTFVQQ